MKENFLIRNAEIKDIDFLVEATINANKGSGNKLHYCTLFNISEAELCSILKKIFRENIPDFELNVKNFMVAEYEGYPVAAYTGWVEGIGGIPSGLLKISAFRTFLSKSQIAHYQSVAYIDAEIALKRDNLTLQLETTYVKQEYRRMGIAALLTDALIKKEKNTHPAITKAQVQLFKENQAAFLCQSKLGFIIVEEKKSDNPEILNYMPGRTRVKMEKIIS
jgi:ribosomal protein S18 acetylase RimI-like enzyme